MVLRFLRCARRLSRHTLHTGHDYAEHLHQLLHGLDRVQHLGQRISILFTTHRLAYLVYRLGYPGIVLGDYLGELVGRLVGGTVGDLLAGGLGPGCRGILRLDWFIPGY
ncbi:MAG: hypothetical protein FJZ94_02530 [Chloroflexi bacterium]|nr:hypothetical protein [Chloroflexota bacterium]